MVGQMAPLRPRQWQHCPRALGPEGVPQLLISDTFPVLHTGTWECCGGDGGESCVILKGQSSHRKIVFGGPQEAGEGPASVV